MTPPPGPTSALAFAWVALLLAAFPWSNDVAATPTSSGVLGGLKVALLLFAGLVAVVANGAARGRQWRSVAVRLLLAYGGVTFLGAFIGSSAVDASLRSVRLLFIVLVGAQLAAKLGVWALLVTTLRLSVALSALAVLGSAAGVSPWGLGRLGGFIPPLHPNSLAQLVGVGCVAAGSLWATGRRTTASTLGACLVLFPALYLTTSRTAFAALALGLTTSLLMRNSDPRGRFLLGLTGLVVVSTLIAGDPLGFHNVVQPPNKQNDLTFTGRSYAWSAALHYHHDFLSLLFGSGLDVKSVPVSRAGLGVQTLDGTWHSTYVEAGVAGVTALFLACLRSLTYYLRVPATSDHVGLAPTCVGVLLFLIVQSLTESTLNDSSFALALLAGLGSLGCTMVRSKRRKPASGQTAVARGSSKLAVTGGRRVRG